ncbi:hypothetical protein LJC60_07980 [Ruminococcaceae bacterium OttesenSCG-928-D13]|nr:hypothetical protein [Ruminococcaceae bacterium OttesenSCG-928-D13]
MGNVLNLQGLLLAIPLVALVLLGGWWFGRRGKKRPPKPGQYLRYQAPGKTAAACRGLLGKPEAADLFGYALEGAASGGWYIHFTRHNPTEQLLDTLFLLQFEDEDPAVFSLRFKREAFGMKEPVIGEDLLDSFFAEKLGAERLPHTPEAEPPKAGKPKI